MAIPIGGESIGRAYVRIIADGDGLPESVRNEMRKAEPEVEKSGGRASERYRKGFNEEMKRNNLDRDIAQSIEKGSGQSDARMRIIGGKKWDQISKGLTDRLGSSDIASRITDGLRKDFERGASFGSILDRLETDLVPQIQDAEREITDEVKRAAAERERVTRKETDERNREFASLYNTIESGAAKVNRSLAGLDADRARRARRNNNNDLRDFEREFANLVKAVDSAPPSIKRAGSLLGRLTQQTHEQGDAFGVAFGRGSRNDFLNFFGSFTRAGFKAVGFITGAIDKVFEFGKAVKGLTGDGAGIGGLKDLPKLFAGGGKAAASLGASAAAAGVGLAIMLLVLGPIASVLVLLTGAVLALAASLTGALIGGVAALSALVLPLAAGLGVLVAAFLSLDDATKKMLGQRLQPLVAEFKNLGKVAAGELFKDAGDQAERLGRNLDGLQPITRKTASALSDVADGFINGLGSSNFDAFLAVMETFIPNALRKLGHIATDTLGGIGGLFRAIAAPGGIADRFLNFLGDAADDFNRFANSGSGQNKLADFFERAGDSAASIGDVLGSTIGLISDLFNAGQGTGDNIFDSLSKNIEDFRRYIKSDPDILKDFFASSERFAGSLGRIVVGIGEFIDALDSAASRAELQQIIDGLGAAFNVLAFGVDAARFNLMVIAAPFRILIGLLTNGLDGAKAAFLNSLADILDAVAGMGSILGKIPGVPDDLGDGAKHLADQLHEAADRINGEKIKPEVDTSDLKKANGLAHTTDESLRILFGLPPITPKVNPKDLNTANESTKGLLRHAQEYANSPEAKPKVNRTELLEARLATLRTKQATEEMFGVAKKGTTIKIKRTEAQLAKSIVDDLAAALRNLPLQKTIRINTVETKNGKRVSGRTTSATGSIVVGEGQIERVRMAVGGMLNSQTLYRGITTGEAGREAIVPLDRPLNEVDPSVRYLSAIARGMQPGGSRVVTISPTIITPTKDPVAVAHEVANEIFAGGGGLE